MSANPQHVDKDAYDKLEKANFPITLPFDQSLEIIRLYLDHLGTSRYDVMRAFGPTSSKLDSEFLRLTENEYEIVTGKDFASGDSSIRISDLFVFQNENLTPILEYKADKITSGKAVTILQAKLKTDGEDITLSGNYDGPTVEKVKAFQLKHGLNNNGVVDADDWVLLSTIKPGAVGFLMKQVPEFLQRTNLNYVELVELLKTIFVNPHQEGLVKLKDAGITSAEIQKLIDTHFVDLDLIIKSKLEKGWFEPRRRQTIFAYNCSLF